MAGNGLVSPDFGSLKHFSDGLRCRSGSRDDVTLRNRNNWGEVIHTVAPGRHYLDIIATYKQERKEKERSQQTTEARYCL